MKHEFAVIHEIEGLQVLCFKDQNDEDGLQITVKFFSPVMNGWASVGFGYDDQETLDKAFEMMKDPEIVKGSLTQIVKGLSDAN